MAGPRVALLALAIVASLAACMTKGEGVSQALFSTRVVGHWQRPGDTACADGVRIAHEGKRLVIASSAGRQVYSIKSDVALAATLEGIEPATIRGQTVKLSPEFFATADARSFNLIVEGLPAARQTWSPCELR